MSVYLVMQTVRELGLSGRSKGYHYLVEAVDLAVKMDYMPFCITKDIYPTVARKYATHPANVEFAIRNAAWYVWDNNRLRLDQMAGYELQKRPSNREFLEILVSYVRECNQR